VRGDPKEMHSSARTRPWKLRLVAEGPKARPPTEAAAQPPLTGKGGLKQYRRVLTFSSSGVSGIRLRVMSGDVFG